MTLSKNTMLFLGCRYTSGVGLADQTQCYTNIMSKHLHKEEVNLAYIGANNYSSFDTLSALHLIPHSSLVLQITSLARIKYYDHDHHEIKDRIFSNPPFSRTLMSVYTDEFLIYELDRYLKLITKYTKAARANLIIWDVANTFDGAVDLKIRDCLKQFKEYIHLTSALGRPDSYRVDNGTDGEGKQLGAGHPGPESHKLIAKKLVDHYNALYS
jgi:hypothetical protein